MAGEEYRKQQDLIFQELEEKERLLRQATGGEWWNSVERRAKRHRKLPTVCRMLVDGKGCAEVDAFLDQLDAQNP